MCTHTQQKHKPVENTKASHWVTWPERSDEISLVLWSRLRLNLFPGWPNASPTSTVGLRAHPTGTQQNLSSISTQACRPVSGRLSPARLHFRGAKSQRLGSFSFLFSVLISGAAVWASHTGIRHRTFAAATSAVISNCVTRLQDTIFNSQTH